MNTTKTLQDIIDGIDSHIRKHDVPYRDWYVGIASDPRERLFVDHGVRENGDAWIHKDCGTDTAARSVETFFLAKGCQGGSGGGNWRSRHVYAYRTALHTDEDA